MNDGFTAPARSSSRRKPVLSRARPPRLVGRPRERRSARPRSSPGTWAWLTATARPGTATNERPPARRTRDGDSVKTAPSRDADFLSSKHHALMAKCCSRANKPGAASVRAWAQPRPRASSTPGAPAGTHARAAIRAVHWTLGMTTATAATIRHDHLRYALVCSLARIVNVRTHQPHGT
jgi:hypothetical protein